jgi:cytosine deaminase
MDLIIRDAQLRHTQGTRDIGVTGGTIAEIAPHIEKKGQQEIQAGGRLTVPTFVEPHVHLDKALISGSVRPNRSGTLEEAIEIIWERKRAYTVEDIVERAGRVLRWGIGHGTTIFRTNVDVDTIGGLVPMEALLEVKRRFAGAARLQIVAFPQEGILQDPGTEELLREAMRMGADVVGGMPFNERTPEDRRRHIDICFRLAGEFGADLDMHVDETDDPAARTLELVAARTIEENYQGRVTAVHTCALAAYDDAHAAWVIDLVARAGLHMVTNPATNLMLQGRLDREPRRRGITRVKELLAAGINVTYGQDCLQDTFYPTFGQADPLEVGQITAHAAQMSRPEEIETLFDMATVNAARVLRLQKYGIEVGHPADLNIIDAPTVQEAFRTRADRRHVIARGRVIAETETVTKLKIEDSR